MECKGTLQRTSQSLAWGRNHHHISPTRWFRLGSHICSPCRESTTCLDCQSWSSFPRRVQHCCLFPGVQTHLNDTVKTCIQLSVKQLTTGDSSMTRTWPHDKCVTRAWQEHGENMTWREHDNMTRTWLMSTMHSSWILRFTCFSKAWTKFHMPQPASHPSQVCHQRPSPTHETLA